MLQNPFFVHFTISSPVKLQHISLKTQSYVNQKHKNKKSAMLSKPIPYQTKNKSELTQNKL
jgi:hypothetical protein